MHKALLFFIAVAVVVTLAVASHPATEGFTTLMGVKWTSMDYGTPPALYTKLPIEQPRVVNLAEAGVGNIQPSPAPPSDLPTAPYFDRSKETPNPYRDPVLEPAKYIRILRVKEDLQAFFGFQAFMLEERCDPSIQIPLTRARADMKELIDVQSVMERNPGIQSRINNKQLDDIQSNLEYLRAILHNLESSNAIQSEALEGFANAPVSDQPTTVTSSSNTPVLIDARATLKDLQEFQIKVVVEIKRLEASGTSDPVINGRLNTLNRIKNDVDDVIERIQNGSLTPNTVPIFKMDIEKALPVLGKPSDPLPQILRNADLPPAVASLFPGGLSPKDTEQALQINNIVKGYMKNIFEGASWGLNVNLKYDNPKVLAQQKAIAEAMAKAKEQGIPMTGIPGVVTDGVKGLPGATPDQPLATPAIARKIQTYEGYDAGLPGSTINRILPTPKSGTLDWKTRSQQIKEQVRRRGMNPQDFGALPDDATVSSEFSWRGYTHMMCNRLAATTDPGLPITVGCPPSDWEGWRE
jgi:hypothetical protein